MSNRKSIDIHAGESLHVELWYPKVAREPGGPTGCSVKIGLTDVRAANAITVHFDHDRDAWVCTMENFGPHGQITNEVVEVACIDAWANEDVARDKLDP